MKVWMLRVREHRYDRADFVGVYRTPAAAESRELYYKDLGYITELVEREVIG